MDSLVFRRASKTGVKLEKIAVPEKASAGLVLIKVHACGVNPVDAKYNVGDKLPESIDWIAKYISEGLGVGFDFSGVIEDISPDVAKDTRYEHLKRGDAVFGCTPPYWGSMKNYINCPPHQFAKFPKDKLTFEEAAACPLVGLTSLQFFKDHDMVEGQRLLVIGASGGVGSMATRLATLKGAKVTGICSGKNVALVKQLGACNVLDYRDTTVPILEQIKAIVKEEGPFHLVLDTVSSHSGNDRAFNYEKLIRTCTEPILIGVGEGFHEHNYCTIGGQPTEWFQALLKRSYLKWNIFPKGRELCWVRFPYATSYLEDLSDLADKMSFKPLVGKVFPFDQDGVDEAFTMARSRRAIGKIVLQVEK